ncbi:MAG: polyprenyl synthetase family protein [Defluviitaleaceae bacterium]|nr:polyprenyl synthetase family protein [Defluviitaleaceae bacterium]
MPIPDRFNEPLNRQLQALISECEEPLLMEVMAYAVLGEGKRIRPKLLLAAYEAVAGEVDFTNAPVATCTGSATAIDFACAIEMIHAYSLAHDDLPAMDNDDMRRGRPTCHKAYTEAMAILAGDGLLSLAVEVMARRVHEGTHEQARTAQALYYVIKAAGVNGMVGGQVSDITNEGKPINAETLAAIHRRKTGCLITAALEAGAILGGGMAEIQTMTKLGQVLGLAFQIRDDILDVTSTTENLGKPIGSDTKNQKATYVTIHGMAAAEAEYARLSHEAFNIVKEIECKTSALRDLVSQTIKRTK